MTDVDAEPEDDWKPKCYDCERRVDRRYLQPTEVAIPNDDGMGYEMIPVPMCAHCRGERFGHECPNCGLTHSSRDSATYCCQRRPGEAPDCIECGRRMKRGAHGHDPVTGPSVEWAECEACEIGWGRFTGWHYPDGEDDE